MENNKKIIIGAAIALGVAVLGGLGFWYCKTHCNKECCKKKEEVKEAPKEQPKVADPPKPVA